MLLGADQMALVPWELPLPSLAFLAAGSGGRGINLLLALCCLGVAEAGAWPHSPLWCWGQAGGLSSPRPALFSLGSPISASLFPGGFSLFLGLIPGFWSPGSVQAGGLGWGWVVSLCPCGAP